MSSTDTSSYKVGGYSGTNEVYLNPLKTSTDNMDLVWKPSTIKFEYDERDPTLRLPGSFGEVVFFPGMEGPFKETQSITMDSGLLYQDYSEQERYRQQYMKDYQNKYTK